MVIHRPAPPNLPDARESQHHAVHTVQTWLRDEHGGAVLSTCHGPSLRVSSAGPGEPPHWDAGALLVAAVDVGVRAEFLRRAEADDLALVFYESTALGRWMERAGGPDLLDLFVEPRVGVHCAADVVRAHALLTDVGTGSLVARALRAPLRVQPTVEIWAAPHRGPGGAAPA